MWFLFLITIGVAIESLTAYVLGGLAVLTVISFTPPSFTPTRLSDFKPAGIAAVLPVAILTCMSQAVAPELVRGLAHQPALIPRAIRRGLIIGEGDVTSHGHPRR